MKFFPYKVVGAQRNAAKMSLKFPWNYIQVDDLKTNSEEEIPGHFPDVCIGKLYERFVHKRTFVKYSMQKQLLQVESILQHEKVTYAYCNSSRQIMFYNLYKNPLNFDNSNF